MIKLSLNKETLRSLNAQDVAGVAGAAKTYTCPYSAKPVACEPSGVVACTHFCSNNCEVM